MNLMTKGFKQILETDTILTTFVPRDKQDLVQNVLLQEMLKRL